MKSTFYPQNCGFYTKTGIFAKLQPKRLQPFAKLRNVTKGFSGYTLFIYAHARLHYANCRRRLHHKDNRFDISKFAE